MESAAVRILALLGRVPRRSTGSVLTCSASGGPKGGIVEFTLDDGNRLAKSGGSLPYKYGARESIGCYCQPNLQNIQWRNVGSGNFKGSEYVCSLDADERPIEVRCKNAEYVPLISVVTPNGIEAVSVDCVTYGVPTNYAGGIGMEFKLRLNPLDVCFSGTAVEEVPCDIGLREGYFAMPIFAELQSHTRNGPLKL